MTQAMGFPPFGVPPLGGIPTEVGTPNAEEPRARRHNENCCLFSRQGSIHEGGDYFNARLHCIQQKPTKVALMLIINADDWGRSVAETNAALKCFKARRITSVSAMVLMKDSERAAELAKNHKLDVGLHLNFAENFTGDRCPGTLGDCQNRIVSFLMRNKYSQLLYNPFLRKQFSYSYEAQAEEFRRLYGNPPSHVDGHHHMHLCANLLLSKVIPVGTKMRRSFSFWPGEKSLLNRTYRALVDRWLARRYRLPDYFFCLFQCIQEKKLGRVAALAKTRNVELMTHPIVQPETEYLMSDDFGLLLQRLDAGSYSRMGFVAGPSPSPVSSEEDPRATQVNRLSQ